MRELIFSNCSHILWLNTRFSGKVNHCVLKELLSKSLDCMEYFKIREFIFSSVFKTFQKLKGQLKPKREVIF